MHSAFLNKPDEGSLTIDKITTQNADQAECKKVKEDYSGVAKKHRKMERKEALIDRLRVYSIVATNLDALPSGNRIISFFGGGSMKLKD